MRLFARANLIIKISNRYLSKMINKPVNLPPNILISTENEQEFGKVKASILNLLGKNSYTVYRLDLNDPTSHSLWMKNCVLLITIENLIEDEVLDRNDKLLVFINYLNSGGNILSLPSESFKKIDSDQIAFSGVKSEYYKEPYFFETDYENDYNMKKHYVQDLPQELFYFYKEHDGESTAGTHFISKVALETILI